MFEAQGLWRFGAFRYTPNASGMVRPVNARVQAAKMRARRQKAEREDDAQAESRRRDSGYAETLNGFRKDIC